MFIGCAGGGDLTLVLEVELLPPPAHAPQGAGAAAGNGTTGGDMVAYQVCKPVMNRSVGWATLRCWWLMVITGPWVAAWRPTMWVW